MKRALLSVTDKTGIVAFAHGLLEAEYELLSTGGTAKALREAGLRVTDVSEVTGFPEMLDGRLKTLHPMVHGALLGDRRNPDHQSAMEEAGIHAIDVVAVNLYAFARTVSGPHTFAEAVESIDIGGPTMIRSAAKNSANVTIVVDPQDYPVVLENLEGENLEKLRRSLMGKAFRHTAHYDAMIARYLSGPEARETMTWTGELVQELRYGENPHQLAAVYRDPLVQAGVAHGRLLWGKELSYNNLLDADAAWELVSDLSDHSCAIIKHGNPCGAAHTASCGESYTLARESDPISAFGGIAAFHGVVDGDAARAMTAKGNFLEVVLGTEFTDEALEIFREKSGWGQSVRLVACHLAPAEVAWTLRSIRGGFLAQTGDEDPCTEWQVVTQRKPTDDELAALRFQWRIVQHVKSNAIVVGTGSRLLGTGAGQMNRVQSVRLALEQAGVAARGAAMASDAFFPFPDSIEAAAAAGIVAVIQPGGSKKDDDSISAADAHGISMIFTGTRHFKH